MNGRPSDGLALELSARSGHRLVAAPTMQVLAARDRKLRLLRLDQLRRGDFAVIRYGGAWPSASPPMAGFDPAPAYGSQKRVDIPVEMSEELAFFLGAYVSEGHYNPSNWSVVITHAVPEVLERVAAAVEEVFGVVARVVHPPTRCSYAVVASKRLVEFINFLGCGARSHVKRIPAWVLCSSWTHVRAFMEGLFLDAFTAWMGRTPKWGICVASPGLLDDVQSVLTNLGVVHGRCEKRDAATGNLFGEVYAVGEPAQALLRAVPFAEPDKRARAEQRLLATPSQSTADVVPIVAPRQLAELIPRDGLNRGSGTMFGFPRDPRTKNVSRRTLERLATVLGVDLGAELRVVLDERMHFVPVTRIGSVGSFPQAPMGGDERVSGFARRPVGFGGDRAREGAAPAFDLRLRCDLDEGTGAGGAGVVRRCEERGRDERATGCDDVEAPVRRHVRRMPARADGWRTGALPASEQDRSVPALRTRRRTARGSDRPTRSGRACCRSGPDLAIDGRGTTPE